MQNLLNVKKFEKLIENEISKKKKNALKYNLLFLKHIIFCFL